MEVYSKGGGVLPPPLDDEKGAQILSTLGGELFWVAKDVCDVLGYANSRMALEKLDEDELMSEILTSGGQKREMQCINEPGLWKLIFRSNKPIAKELTRWVTHEVLPTIRKTGVYTVHKELQEKFEKEVAEYKDKITGLESRIYDLEEDLSDDAKEDRRQFLESQKKNKDNAQLFIKRYTRKGYGADFHELYDAYEQYCKARGERAGIMLEFENNITTAHRYVFENLNGRFVANIELDKDAMKRDFSAYKEYLPTPSPTPAKKKTKKDDGIDMDKWNGKF